MISDAAKGPTQIVKARVENVYRDRRVCDLVVLGPNSSILKDVPWSTPMMSGEGSGIDFVPEKNSLCWVVESTSDFTDPNDITNTVLAWQSPARGDVYGPERKDMLPGEIVLSTKAGAYIHLDNANGDLSIQAGPACSTIHFLMDRIIETLCAEYELITDVGGITWQVLGQNQPSDPVQFKLDVKKQVGDEIGFFDISVFSDAGSGTVQFKVRPEGVLEYDNYESDGTGLAFNWEISDYGQSIWQASGDAVFESTGAMSLQSGSSMSIHAPTVDIAATPPYTDGAESLLSSFIEITPEGIKIRAPKVILETSSFSVVSGAAEMESFAHAAYNDEGLNKKLVHVDILDWLFSHVHITGAVASTGPLGTPVEVSPTMSEAYQAGNAAVLAAGDPAALLTAIKAHPIFAAAIPAIEAPSTIEKIEDVTTQETVMR